MDLWAFLWPIYSDYEIYLCLFPLNSVLASLKTSFSSGQNEVLNGNFVKETGLNTIPIDL